MLILSAPAKINLTLEILSRREDGYHNLRSLMAPISLCDRIEIEAASSASFTTNMPTPNDDNIVLRALTTIGVHTPLRVTLEKRIPVGGGLGGGSSDAAAILHAAMSGALHAALDTTVEDTSWITVARSLGSDVPFFLTGTGALVEATGERITAVGKLPPWWALIVQPSVPVVTAQAYRLLAAARTISAAPSRPRNNSVSLRAVDALQRGDFAMLQEHLCNDFHALILAEYPIIARAHAAMLAAGAPQALLSGSGSCLFSLFADETSARETAQAFTRDDAISDIFVTQLVSDERWR
jgi:4-diphosphocytidyl-2-C-methyl-D-erythritol kinase